MNVRGRVGSTSGQCSPTTTTDLEVANVMQFHRDRPSKLRSQSTAAAAASSSFDSRPYSEEPPTNSSFSSSYRARRSETSIGIRLTGQLSSDGTRKSAFSPYKPTTVLTNLQRGNIETQTPCFIPDPSIHQLAAQGELILEKESRKMDDVCLEELDGEGLTPLIWASAYGQVPMVNVLLSRGANVKAENGRGENALLLASCNGHSEIVRILLDRGLDVDHTDEDGNSALMYAAFNNHAHCAQELLQRKADVTKENHYGDTAFCIAVARGSKQVQLILERHFLSLLRSI